MIGVLTTHRPTSRWMFIGTLLLIAMIAATTLSASGSSAPEISPRPHGDIMSLLAQDASATPIAAATPVALDGCESIAPGVGSEPWVRVELYFGTTIPNDGGVVTAEQWQDFLDEEITPRFPDGLTVLEGYGQFLNSSDVIIAEDSIVLILFIPLEFAASSSDLVEEIRDAYEVQFEQESVLRADSAPVCISF